MKLYVCRQRYSGMIGPIFTSVESARDYFRRGYRTSADPDGYAERAVRELIEIDSDVYSEIEPIPAEN